MASTALHLWHHSDSGMPKSLLALRIAVRSGIGAALVWIYMLVRRERISLADGHWKPGLWGGLLFAAEYLLLGEALRYTSASHAVVFLYTAPIFAALILHFLIPSERMNGLQWSGIGLAFSGSALVIAGVVLVSAESLIRQSLRQAASQ